MEFEVTPVQEIDADRWAAITDRQASVDDVTGTVAEIIETVREEGDQALVRYARRFDGVDLTVEDLTMAIDSVVDAGDVPDGVRAAIDTAAANIRSFHRRQRPQDWRTRTDGRELGRRFRPIERVGVYVPGGAAAYPSSALMGIIPADVAGVEEIVAVTPPTVEPNSVTLWAMAEAGVDAIYRAGGAQAIAALAYGTESIDPVDKIVGPGNRYVAAAKRAVQADVAIEFVAGPSEILVVADRSADAKLIAADLIAQAEHDTDATAALVTLNETIATETVEAIHEQVPGRDRADTIRQALSGPASGAFLVDSRTAAAEFANRYAPEHLAIQAEDDEELMAAIPNAGSVFLGPDTPVAAGDYASGTNHILPTGGGARRYGGVSVDTFLRPSTVQRLNAEGLSELRETIVRLAEAEGLEAHAESVRRRFDGSE